jgi:hypothetical protein
MRGLFMWNVVKWLALLLELYSLFVFVNVAFLVPYPYDWKQAVLVATSALTAGVFAFLSSVGTVKLSKKEGKQLRTAYAAPSLLWALVMVTGCAILFIHAITR